MSEQNHGNLIPVFPIFSVGIPKEKASKEEMRDLAK